MYQHKFSTSVGPINREPIALIGIGCRFPGGANSPSAFWDLLINGKDAIVETPKDRWDIRRFYDPNPDKPGKMYVRAGGFLKERIDQFDALFFGMSPREAVCLDPQQRVLLEVAWEALEDAGLVPERLAGSDTGIYIGAFMLDNMLTQLSPINRNLIGTHTAVSSTMSILSNRLSYFFDFRGPSITMDTACSSSLVALHQACQALWQGECALALAGGVNIMYRPENPISMCKGQFLSPDGRCKSFDARADGYGRGEGAGIVVLKPISAALRDGDDIYALVCGTGVNQDGRTNGITVPNPESQEVLIRQVCAQAGIRPQQIRYFEAHGTGTSVGDPIEARALGAVVGQDRAPENACVVGSVKANIGHLEAASGVAGVIKTALCLRHKQIPPLANLQNPNPNIAFEELGLRLPRGVEPIPEGQGPVYVGVNSFGYGGTNAHAILKESPYVSQRLAHVLEEAIGRPYLLPISARSAPALTALAQAYLDNMSGADAPSLHNLCYSASVHRGHHDHRLAITAYSLNELSERLQSFIDHGHGSQLASGKAAAEQEAQPVFVFTGMGPQWWAMGRELLQYEPVFRKMAKDCDTIFQALAGWSILAEMMADEAHSRITETQIAQPANFVVQAGLAALWRSWGIEPAAIVGHSVGEVTAAYVAGVLDLEDAIRVSYQRSRIQKKAAGLGTMLAAGLSEQEAQALLVPYEGRVSLAAANSPSASTLAGDREALEEIAARLEAQGVFNRFLQVEVAYHSPYMDPLLDEVRASLSTLHTRAPVIPLYSTVTGTLVREASYDAQYWCQNIRRPVLFAKAMEGLIEAGYRLFLEVGPHPVLSTSIKECLAHRKAQGTTIASLRREQPERGILAEAMGALYTAGYSVDWQRLYPAGGRYIRLPTYPWQRETYWQESAEAIQDRLGSSAHVFLENRLSTPNPSWETSINENFLAYLPDHRVDGVVVFPGAAYVEAGLAIHHHLHGKEAYALENLVFHKALVVESSDEPVLHLGYDGKIREYAVYSRTSANKTDWTLHATGTLSLAPLGEAAQVALEEIRNRCREAMDAKAHYHQMQARGLQYGPWFQGVVRLWRQPGEVLALIAGQQSLPADDLYHLHPTLLDACFQSLIAVLNDEGNTRLYMPVRIRQIRFHASPRGQFWSHGRLTQYTADAIEGDITLCDGVGNILVEVRGLHCKALAARSANVLEHIDQWTYQFLWESAASPPAPDRPGRWLLFEDRHGIGAQLARQLESLGAEGLIRVSPGEDFRQTDTGHFQIRRDSQEDMNRLMEAVALEGYQGVAYLWGLDTPVTATDPTGTADTTTGLYLIQALARRAHGAAAPRLFIITRGAQQVFAEESTVGLAQAPLVGLARVAFNEHPELRCAVIDLEPNDGAFDTASLVNELLAGGAEDDIALRGTGRYVHRLIRVSRSALEQEASLQEPILAPAGHPWTLEMGIPGDLESLRFRELYRREPGPGEVAIEVHAIAMRGDEIAKIDTTGLPIQIAGVIVGTGGGVQGYRIGDAIVAWLQGTFATYITVSSDILLAVPKPDSLGFAESAVLPRAFMAAYYGLYHLARLQQGETVLIHAAAGDSAPAAIQVAKWLGARILATASTKTQRDHLCSLGIEQVMEAGSLDMADQVMRLTGGGGVDVVLDSRTDADDSHRLCLLAPCGRYIRLGKETGIAKERVTTAFLEQNLTFATADIDRLRVECPERSRQLLQAVWERFQAGQFTPSAARVFPAARVAEAFALAQSDYMGAVVVSLQDGILPVLPLAVEKTLIRADASYLITGGLGGFGLKIAEWLVAQGARHLVLMGRRGAATPQAQQTVQALERAGAKVRVVAADIGQEAQVTRLMAEITASLPPLKGIIHTAAVLDDGPLADLDMSRLNRVMAPKALGAWYLHQQTQNSPLDFFVLFSSISSLIGNARQGNYVAANAFLDGLASYRRARGLPAISINWGVLGDVGMAAANQEVGRHLEHMGIKAFTPAQAMEALGQVLEWNPIQIGIMAVDWQTWGRFDPISADSPRFSRLITREGRQDEDSVVAELQRSLQLMEPNAAKERFAALLAEQVAATLRLSPDRVDLQQSLTHMGVDSLMAIELQTGIRASFGLEVSTLELMKGNSIAQLASQWLAKLATQKPSLGIDSTESPPSLSSAAKPSEQTKTQRRIPEKGILPEMAGQVLAELERLSDAEVDDLLTTVLLEKEGQP